MAELLEQMLVEVVAFSIFGVLLLLVAIIWSRFSGRRGKAEGPTRGEDEL